MKDFVRTVSENIAVLRKSRGLTQLEFGAKINYSDKSVSKWERGESLPDLIVINSMAETFGVDVDFFFTEHPDAEQQKKTRRTNEFIMGSRIAVSLLLVSFVFLVAAVIYVYTALIQGNGIWQSFVWAVPVSALTLLVFYHRFFGGDFDVYFGSAFIWTLLGALYIQFFVYNIWIIFFIGIPVQAIIIILSVIRAKQRGDRQ